MPEYSELAEEIIREKPDKRRLEQLKIQFCRKNKASIPTDIRILLDANNEHMPILRKYLQTKPVRSQSGVSVVAIMTKPHKCPHGKCIVCPGGVGSEFGSTPQSYTGFEPATRRAKRNRYDPYLQAFNRLEQYVAAGHIPQKIELIVMGGTFMALSRAYRESYIAFSLKALNDFGKIFFPSGTLDISKYKIFFEMPGDVNDDKREISIRKRVLALKGRAVLDKEQQRNEHAFCRCVGLTIETRSDYATRSHGLEMLRLGATRVEIGVQSVYDLSLRKMERGHDSNINIEAIKAMKDLGFKINLHYMPGLFVSRKKDLEGMKQLFSDSRYRPDMLKVYPCMVVKGTKLYSLWKQGKYKPLSTKQAACLIAEFKRDVPIYCRIMRVQRDIPSDHISAGVDRTNLRQYVAAEMKKHGWSCRCIRCREIGGKAQDGRVVYKTLKYEASDGMEYFVSAEDKESLYGFCRLRMPSDNAGVAFIRELHVYGVAAIIGDEGEVQHRGIGKKLLSKAESIARKNGIKKILVISGIGVRDYYRKLGYRKEGYYMVSQD